MNVNNLSIRTRLGLAFGIIILLMIALIAFSITQLQRIGQLDNEIVEVDMAKLEAARTLEINTRANAARIMSLFITEDPDQVTEVNNRIKGNTDNITKAMATLNAMVDSEHGKALLGAVKAASDQFNESFDTVATQLARHDRETAILVMNSKTTPDLEQLQTAIKALVQNQVAVLNDSHTEAQQALSASQTWMIIVSVITVVIGIVMAWWISLSITAPLKRAVELAESVASGDLRQEIDVTSRDETGQLLLALKNMNQNLAGIISQVTTGAHAISAATNEIAQGNIDLSSRTEQQASSLEETASSLEEMTSTVHQNVSHAQDVSRLANSAATTAHDGGVAVSRVIDTMASIEETAKRVVSITAIIDGIAFQTNILALNAAVEAARAGETGRGFAVVATEVRSLAHRAASAAKDIKDLINDSVQQIETGGKLVNEAGQTIQDVVNQAKRVSHTIDEIAAASQEQSAGIDQINQAVLQMDQVTQQNAALVEEAAAAASALENQARQLTQAVSMFKLSDKIIDLNVIGQAVPGLTQSGRPVALIG